jgi:hypothetical protein
MSIIMNGAEGLLQTLIKGGVDDVCFANTGNLLG